MDGRTEEKRTAAAAPGARSDIAEARKNIDRIDREMAELFAERMQAAAVVAAYIGSQMGVVYHIRCSLKARAEAYFFGQKLFHMFTI